MDRLGARTGRDVPTAAAAWDGQPRNDETGHVVHKATPTTTVGDEQLAANLLVPGRPVNVWYDLPLALSLIP